jgi:hypothetical protein
MIPENTDDFTNCEKEQINFKDNSFEISSLITYFCDQEKYSDLCRKIKSKEAELWGFRYKISYNIGISKESLTDEDTVFVE